MLETMHRDTKISYISLLIIPCIIYHVTNKETLNLEPWTNVNLYPMNTFFKSMHHIVNFYANVRMWISESYQL